MRLIDADVLIDEIENFYLMITGSPKPITVVRECKKSIEEIVDMQPTAYNVDAVVEQLKAEGCILDDAAGNRAVEIIEGGGSQCRY